MKPWPPHINRSLAVSNAAPPPKKKDILVCSSVTTVIYSVLARYQSTYVGKCSGSIKHSLPVTPAKAGPSSPQNDSDWPCDDSNIRKITENTGQRRNDTLSAVAVWLVTELIPPTRSQHFWRSAAPTQKSLLELLWGGRSRPPRPKFSATTAEVVLVQWEGGVKPWVKGAKPTWSWNTFSFWTFTGSRKCVHFSKIW